MKAEIIAVGSELTNGAKLDTNSQWLSTELSARGIEVIYHTAVADSMDLMVWALRVALRRAHLILLTGGLGPTLDDITRQAVAELLHVSLILDHDSLQHVEQMFQSRGREMPARNRIQAMFPAGAEPLPNPIGTAPGMWCEVPKLDADHHVAIAAMPGVPSEMRKMFLEQVIPRLPVGEKIIKRARVNCFGVGESACEEMLEELTARGRNPEVGITVHEATITLRINAVGNSIEECDQMIADTKKEIHHRLGDLVFGEEDEELEDVVMSVLANKQLTLSTVESGTGGLLAHRLTNVDAHPELYHGGIVIPGGSRHWELLDFPENWFQEHSLASAETAVEMASRCRLHFETDFALAVTESSPSDESAEGFPTAHVALSSDEGEIVVPHQLLGDRSFLKSRAAKAALNLVRVQLLQQ
ncbi:MAG: CinA family nicotinamide mononucleotide deamidase-related protein [Planctomycetaceae bacterium]|nr:CinA family nicotinamide mononucleotide deamidase-related protein [Planctomycetaceae bacterium]